MLVLMIMVLPVLLLDCSVIDVVDIDSEGCCFQIGGAGWAVMIMTHIAGRAAKAIDQMWTAGKMCQSPCSRDAFWSAGAIDARTRRRSLFAGVARCLYDDRAVSNCIYATQGSHKGSTVPGRRETGCGVLLRRVYVGNFFLVRASARESSRTQ